MKYFIITLILFFSFQLTIAQNFDVEAIKISGDDYKRINLVILSEGYQSTEFTKFETDVTNFLNVMFSQSPFSEYSDYFNVYIIKVPSNESGADHPGTGSTSDETNWPIPITTVDTYFNATFDAFGLHRFLYFGIDYADAASAELKIQSVLADNFPTYDQVLILVNTPYYGGTGGEFPIASTSSDGIEIAIHELGHSLFDLKDEYLLPDVFYSEAINMTQETNSSLIKWRNWVGSQGIDIFPYGTSGIPATWYKPRHGECKMEVLSKPFCAVCKEGMIEKIHSLVSPIDAYTPLSNTLDNSSFPINFALNLIKPIPNTLESEWTLNGSNFGFNVDDIIIQKSDLISGINTLTTVVTDATSFLRVDNHDSFHVYTVTWTIDNATLGIEDITSETNILNISMFPNPTNDIVNFKLESEKTTNLKLEINSLDGKKIRTELLSNYETYELDISSFNSGIYITNFYSNNVLIASKKLVKN